MKHIYTTLNNLGSVKLNEPLSKHTTFKIGGDADLFFIVEETNKLIEALQYLDNEGVPYMVLGGGSNMLVADQGFRGVVIQIKDKAIEIDGTSVMAAAGAITVQVAHASVKAGLTGFEWGVGVPGTIGGAVRGNAGAMGVEMVDNVEKVEVYKDGEVYTLTNEKCEFSYRSSIFKQEGGVVLRVWLSLKKAPEGTNGMKKALEVLMYRNTTQPKGFASTGCIFTNPDAREDNDIGIKNRQALLQHFDSEDEKIQRFLDIGKISAGWLIEQAGLKGATIGGASVSEVHGNFIVNSNNATAKDVLDLVEKIKSTVYTTYSILLEEEFQAIT